MTQSSHDRPGGARPGGESDPTLRAPANTPPTRTQRTELGSEGGALGVLATGEQIGPFQLVRLLGRGGSGSVFLAERDQGGVRQRVALKLLDRALDDAEAAQRFRLERQILARMEHPYIARLFEGGESADGRPYLAMEFVSGANLVQHCDELEMGLRARIELFVKVCDALAFAHGRLIVHRDIKPSNVLVDAAGNPKLLDFGIAKPLSPMSEHVMVETAHDQRLLTPNYASPEQIEGGLVTTATDVYAAGVLLYELLTGHSPHAAPGETRPTGIAVLASIVRGELAAPSAMLYRQLRAGEASVSRLHDIASMRAEASPARLARRLRGELDAVLLKALAREPTARYASAEAFAAELRHYLAGEPISAASVSWLYRGYKFARRHAWPLTAVASVIGFSLALAVVMSLQAQQLAAERDLARSARAETEQARLAAVQAQAQAERVAEVLAKQIGTIDPVLMGADLRRMVTSGAAGGGRAPLDEIDFTIVALNVIESHLFDRFVRVIGGELTAEPNARQALLRLVGRVLREHGLIEAELAPLQMALSIRDVKRGTPPADRPGSVLALGQVLGQHADPTQALTDYAEVMRERRAVLGVDHPDTLRATHRYGALLLAMGRAREAQPLLEQTVEGRLVALGGEHPETVRTMEDLATALAVQGLTEDAIDQLEAALAVRRLAGPTQTQARLQTQAALIDLVLASGNAQRALVLARDAVKASERELGARHPRTLWLQARLARSLTATDAPEAALAVAQAARQLAGEAVGHVHWLGAVLDLEQARARIELAQPNAARELLARAINSLQRFFVPGHPRLEEARRLLAALG